MPLLLPVAYFDDQFQTTVEIILLQFKGVAQYIANRRTALQLFFSVPISIGVQAILRLANSCFFRFCSSKLQVKNGGNLER